MDIQNILLLLFGANFLVLILNITFWILVSLGDKKVRKREQEMYDKFNQVLDQANQKASQIVLGATDKSNQLLTSTEVMVEDIKQAMRKSFTQAKEKNIQVLGEHLESLQSQNKEMFQDLRSNLTTEAGNLMKQVLAQSTSEMQKFVEEIKQQTVSAQENVDRSLDDKFQGAMKEVEEYKQRQLSKVDSQIKGLVKAAVQEVIQVSLSADQHEHLILETWDKLKEAGKLDSLSNKNG